MVGYAITRESGRKTSRSLPGKYIYQHSFPRRLLSFYSGLPISHSMRVVAVVPRSTDESSGLGTGSSVVSTEVKKMQRSEETNRSIPSLDGLRALSVIAVMLGHTRSALFDRIPFNAVFRHGGLGVAVFFVISGFLITHLLMKELRCEGTINLKRFYLRRTFRIFPPFYAFLSVIAILGLFREFHVSWRSMFVAGTYTWNYVRSPDTWILGHCWSLSLEEQFYLLWPVCMVFFSRRANVMIASGVILLSPLSRVATYFAWPAMRGYIPMMLHTRLDQIMMGCLLSLLIDTDVWQKVKKVALHPLTPTSGIIFLLAIDSQIEKHWKSMYWLTVGISLETVAIAGILLYVVFRHESPLGRILNTKLLRHVGKISYSLYLWQQLFTGPYTQAFPLNILWIVACAEISYLLVERPSLRIRDLVQQRIHWGLPWRHTSGFQADSERAVKFGTELVEH
jgi:peptidoglycan/LPS O-acetylase OafA/YrhL